MMQSVAQALLVSLTGVVCLCLEIYLPGVIVGLFGFCSAVYGLLLMFDAAGPWAAAGLLLADTALGFALFNLSLKILPRTAFGRKVMLAGRISARAADPAEYESLKGSLARVITVLKPTGTVQIGKTRYTARSEEGIVGPGETVEVVAADANTLVVRKSRQN